MRIYWRTIMTKSPTLESLLDELFANAAVIRLILSSKRRKSQSISKATVKPVMIKNELKYQFECIVSNKALHENLGPDESIKKICELVASDFKQVNIMTETEDIQVLASKPDRPRITRRSLAIADKSTQSQAGTAPGLTHNKKKNHVIPEGVPCDFLIRLGVMDENGTVFKKHYSKFRQINRYLDIVKDVLPVLPKDRTLRIIDFGCGKSYLTFALYYYFRVLNDMPIEIIGLDLKQDVIDLCNKVAEDLKYDELTFLCGDISDYTSDRADMVVTLHACDTATDAALINAVSWGSKVILSVPCCQHELFRQIDNEINAPMLKHGIIKDKFTELLTDGLRGLKLESKGYDVAMVEFTPIEHTSKNIMIRAIKRDIDHPGKKKKAQAEYDRLKEFYHVQPAIDKL